MAKILIVTGLLLALAGIILWMLGGKTGWLGHLPGDLRIEKPGFRLYFPFTTMLLLSALLNIILWMIARLGRK